MNPTEQGVTQETVATMQRDWDMRAHTKASAMFFIIDQYRGSVWEFYESGKRHWADIKDALCQFVDRSYRPHGVGIEIGCGIGRITAEACWDFARLYATDISAKMIEKCQPLPGTTFIATPTLIGVIPERADLIFSHIVMQHVPKSVFYQYVAEACEMLKPGGIFITQLAVGLQDYPDEETLLVRGYTVQELEERFAGSIFWNPRAILEEAGISEKWHWLVLEKRDVG